MKISQAIEQLTRLQEQHGDIEVVCLHNLGEHARSQLDIIKGMSYYTTVEHIMHRDSCDGFDQQHVLITL